jgi:hypothetical protein
MERRRDRADGATMNRVSSRWKLLLLTILLIALAIALAYFGSPNTVHGMWDGPR